MVTYSGSGESISDPIIVGDVAGHMDAIRAEYAYIEKKYGTRGVNWVLQQQTLLTPEGMTGRKIDALTIELLTGKVITIFFDITKFWGMELF